MTYRAWWNAREFMFEERFGLLIREAELKIKAQETQLAEQYRKSVAALKSQEP
jgi:hypothetical protein